MAEIKKSVKGLEKLSMVEKVLVGGPIMSDRDVVDDSFSVAFTMVFKDEAARRLTTPILTIKSLANAPCLMWPEA